jgi:hypothetical protein
VFRTIIRSPLLPAFTAALPPACGGRPSPLPDLYWVFYGSAMRELASNELLDQEPPQVWTEIRKEFWLEHGILLPNALPNGDIPAAATASASGASGASSPLRRSRARCRTSSAGSPTSRSRWPSPYAPPRAATRPES